MSERFVEMPSDLIFKFLEERGFARSNGRSRREVVYERGHEKDPNYKVIVYTSVASGSTRARAKGADAIRVCAIHELPGQRGVGVAKLPKVLRTAPIDMPCDARMHHVLDRVLGRMREAYARLSKAISFYEDLNRNRRA